jgi:beta-lactamase regulating signal transducer with metallopeptidase domain
MDYILKASAVLFIFYACYQLFLQKETFFKANRWFLLCGLIIACVIPLIVIPVYYEYTVSNTNSFIVNYNNSTTSVILDEPFDYMQLIIWIYFSGILFFFGKLIVNFLSLRKIFNSSKTKSLGSFKLFETNQNITPFSFFSHIVYNPNQFKADELEHIINHEKVHSKQWHSIDTIISHIACILFWLNPIVWLYKKVLLQNLEFIADQEAQHMSLCEKSYQSILLKTSLQLNQLPFINNFYTSLIKKRIVMLHQSKSNKINKLKMIFVMPLIGLFMISFNTEDVYVETPLEEELSMGLFQTDGIEQIFTNDMSDNGLLLIKKKLAKKGVSFEYSRIKRNKKGQITAIKTEFEYNGDFRTYNVNSDKAMEPFIFMSQEGGLTVGSFTDRVAKTYTTINGNTIIKATGSNSYTIKKAESVSIKTNGNNLMIETDSILINAYPKKQVWTSKYGTKINLNTSENGTSKFYSTQVSNPLFVVDDKIVAQLVFENVDSENIESIFVLKNNVATEQYGERGKNGVVVIKTKKRHPWKIVPGTHVVQTYEIGEPNDSITHKLGKTVYNKTNGATTYTFTSEKSYTSDSLYIVDAQKATKKEFELIDPNSIEFMDILEENKGSKQHGQIGKNGVIIAKTKAFNNALKKHEIKDSKVIIERDDKSKNPIYIVDESIVTATEFKLVHPDNIKSMNVLKSKNAQSLYGEKGKNGALIIITKSPNYSNRNSYSKVKEDGPWKITSEAQSVAVYYVGDDGEKSPEFVISKTSTDSFLDRQKRELNEHGIDAKISKVRRNKAGEITGIKISLNDNNGSKSSASWKGKKDGIPDIVMGKSKDDSLFLREIRN